MIIGNKKITLIYNLETYRIPPAEFAHKCQVTADFDLVVYIIQSSAIILTAKSNLIQAY
jgi:hypothetical protein